MCVTITYFAKRSLNHDPNTNSINGCNTSLGKDAIHRVSTRWSICRIFFQIGMNWCVTLR
ncbi:hypothetical protein ACWATR_23265 [Nostoc sp. UIC 10890]